MARQQTNSLKYYSRDTAQQDNEQYIEAEHGPTGWYIVEKLRMHIYGGEHGYYCDMSDLHKKLFCSKNCKVSLEDFNAVLESCFLPEVGLFDKGLYEEYKILTSDGIQKRWKKIVKECGKRVDGIKKDFLLIIEAESTPPAVLTADKLPVNNTGDAINGGLTNHSLVINSAESTQIKQNEIKQNEIKNLESERRAPAKVFFNDNFFPDQDDVRLVFSGKLAKQWPSDKISREANKFYSHYHGQGWKKSSGLPVVDLDATVASWIYKELEKQGGFIKPPVSPVEKEKNKLRNLSEDEIKQQNFAMVQMAYETFLAGDLKESELPPLMYDSLKSEKVYIVSDLDINRIKTIYLEDAKGAKRRALWEFFTRLKLEEVKNINFLVPVSV